MLDSFEMNKVLGAVLGTCLGVVALNIASGAVFAPGKLDKPGFEIDVPKKAPGNGTTQTPAQPEVPLGQLLASADVSRGSDSAKKCATCHSFEKGGRPLVGPPLWGIVKVTWKAGATKRLLTSFAAIQQAKAAGQVTLARTSLVVNCPIVP